VLTSSSIVRVRRIENGSSPLEVMLPSLHALEQERSPSLRPIHLLPILTLIACGDESPPPNAPHMQRAPLESTAPPEAATEEFTYIEADPDAPEPVPDPPEAPRVEAQPVEHDFDALVAEYLATSPTFAAAVANMRVGVAPPPEMQPVPEPVVEDSKGLGCDKPVPPPSPAALARPGSYYEGSLDADVAWTARLDATPASDLVSPSTAGDWAAPDDGTTPPSDKAVPTPADGSE